MSKILNPIVSIKKKDFKNIGLDMKLMKLLDLYLYQS